MNLRGLRRAFGVMAVGVVLGTVGLAWDFYEHTWSLDPAEIESLLAPAHVLIFAGFAITVLGFLLGLIGLVRAVGVRGLTANGGEVDLL